MTSNDLEKPRMISNADSTIIHTIDKRSKLKSVSVPEIDDSNDEYSDGTFQINNLSIELAIQILSIDKTVRINTVQDLKEFNSQSLSTRAKKGEH